MIQRHAKMLWLRLGFPSDDAMPNDSTAKTTIIFVGNYNLLNIRAYVINLFSH